MPAARSRVERVLPLVLVLGVPILAFTIPFLGPVAALATPVVAGSTGGKVWPVRWWVAAIAGVAVLVLLWTALAVTSSVWGIPGVVEFLLLPLCGPQGPRVRTEPPVLEDGAGVVGATVVSEHHLGASHPELTLFTRADGPGRVEQVDDLSVRVGQWDTDRARSRRP